MTSLQLSSQFLASIPQPPPLTFGTHLDTDSLTAWAQTVDLETKRLALVVEASLAPRAAGFAEATRLLPVISDRLSQYQQTVAEFKATLSSSASLGPHEAVIARLEEAISVLQEISSVDLALQSFGHEPDLQRRVGNFRVLAERVGNLKKFPVSHDLQDRLEQCRSLLIEDIMAVASRCMEISREDISVSVHVPESQSMDAVYELLVKMGSGDVLVDKIFRKFSPIMREFFADRPVDTESVDFVLVDDRKLQLHLVRNPHRVVAGEFPVDALVLLCEFLSLHWKNTNLKIKLGKKIATLFPGNHKLHRGMAIHGFLHPVKISGQISDHLPALRDAMLRPGRGVGASVRGWQTREMLAQISDHLVPEVISERLLSVLELCGSQLDQTGILFVAEISRCILDQCQAPVEVALIVNDLLFLSFLAATGDTEISLIFHVRRLAELAEDRLVPGNLKSRNFQEMDLSEIAQSVTSMRQQVQGVLTSESMKRLERRLKEEIFPGVLQAMLSSRSVTAGLSMGKLKQVLPLDEDISAAHMLLTANGKQISESKLQLSGELRKDARRLLSLNPLLNEHEIQQIATILL